MAAAMRAALIRCRLNLATANYYVMANQGYDSPTELMMTTRDAFDTMVKNAIKSSPPDVNFAAVAIRKLNTFKRWVDERYM